MDSGSSPEHEAHLESGRTFPSSPKPQPHSVFDEGTYDKLWQAQWPSLTKDWANLSAQASTEDQTSSYSCDSPPPTSDSPSSFYTRDSSIFSRSEASYGGAKQALCSPDMPIKWVSGFSSMASPCSHPKISCRHASQSGSLHSTGKDRDDYLLNGGGAEDGRVELSQFDLRRHVNNQVSIDVAHGVDGGATNVDLDSVEENSWRSNVSDSASWASSPSRELHRSAPYSRPGEICDAGAQSEFNISNMTDYSKCIEGSIDVPFAYRLRENMCNRRCASIFDTSHLQNKGRTDACLIDSYPDVLDAIERQYATLNEQVETSCHPSNVHYEHAYRDLEVASGPSNVKKLSDNSYRRASPCRSKSDLHPSSAQPKKANSKTAYSAAVEERFTSSTLHGCFRVATQEDSSCYSLSLDDSDEVLFARPSRYEMSNKENWQWLYSFHSKRVMGKARATRRSLPKMENTSSDLVANMTVSTFRHTKDGGGKYVFDKEVRFVLHETGANNKMNGQPLRPKFNNSLVSGAGHIKGGHQSRMLISSPEGDSENVTPYNLQQSKNECNQPDYVKGESGHKDIRTKSLSSEGSQQTELAAIIITTSSKEKVKPRKPGNQVVAKDAAGWGMKFLENRTESGWGLRLLERLSSNTRGAGDIDADKATTELHDSSIALDGSCLKGLPKGTTSVGENAGPNVSLKTLKKARRCRNRIQVDLTVILPAGIHGLPDVDGADVLQDKSTSSNGPTPLLDRWTSGGNCECGGWDLGCGLSVFNADAFSLSRKSMNVALTRDDCMNWLSPRCPFKLFTQGYKRKMVLVLEVMEAGLFSLSFQAQFSPLQAFAVAVAFFHQQMTMK